MIVPSKTLDALLTRAEKPTRYAGGELNAIKKDLDAMAVRWAFAFPDVYDIGMDNQGMKILYDVLNRREDVACERVFAPWPDMEALMRERGVPLFTLENKAEVRALDVFAFTIPYEIILSNVVNMLDLAGLPLMAADRDESHPLVVGGGAVAFNPEPLADLFDLFVVGEGEEVILELNDAVAHWRAAGRKDKLGFLESLTKIQGVYVPRFFEPVYGDDGKMTDIRRLLPGYKRVFRRVVTNLDTAPYPTKPVVPTLPTIHDRLSVEIQRGCTAGCRFCQAGMIYRPTRERSPETVLHLVEEGLKNTGYEGVSLMSLSAGDYSFINSILRHTNEQYESRMISVQVPSLRVKTLTRDVALEVARVKKGGFTIAPEAGSQRMRDAINKDVTDAEIERTVETIFTTGGQSVKMYFMCGLPDETDEDLLGICDLGVLALRTARRHHRRPKITVSVSTFVPKPFTPYQWARQIDREDTLRRHRILKQNLKDHRDIQIRLHDEYGTFLEGVFSRGDRRVGRALVEAQKLGCKFDGWKEHINPKLWQEAFEKAGIDAGWYLRERDLDEVLPWDHLEANVGKAWLRKEWDRHLKALYIPDCRWGECGPCGACRKETRITTFDGQDPLGPPAKAGEGRTYHHPEAQMPAVAARVAPPADSPELKNQLASLPWRAVRLRYEKVGPARFAGHMEIVSAFQRALKRMGVPVRHSQGFHPHPKMTFSPPLPVGAESRWEAVDVEIMQLPGDLPDVRLLETLNSGQLPEGVRVLEAGPPTFDLNGLALITWDVELPEHISMEDITAAAARFNAATHFEVEGRKRSRDAKEVVRTVTARGPHTLRLEIELSSDNGSVKPSLLVETLLGVHPADQTITKVSVTPASQEPRKRAPAAEPPAAEASA